jgi:hypothetical protein
MTAKMIGPHRKMGRKIDPRREALAREYELSEKQRRRLNLEQMTKCADDAARRLLLGKSS